jgi:hypothetical protein
MSNHPIVYRWSDGSFVEITKFADGTGLRLFFSGFLDYLSSFMISLSPERKAYAASPSLTNLMRAKGVPQQEVVEKYPQIQAKIRGLLLDLGVAPNTAGTLLRGDAGNIAVPFFISEDLWNRRFELAKDQSIGDDSFEAVPDYMGIGNIYRLQIRYDSWSMNWRISWMSGRSGGAVYARKFTSDTFENAVGVVMKNSNIHPESDRAVWETEFVERGTFLIPTPEEVEVFRILDEPLPFFLPRDEAGKWFKGRLS